MRHHPVQGIDKDAINKWKNEGMLLTANGTLQPVSKIIVNDLDGDVQDDANILESCGLSLEQLTIIAQIFKLPVLSHQESDFQYVKESDETLFRDRVNTLIETTLMYLPMAALLESKRSKKSHIEILKTMLDRFYAIKICYCEKIISFYASQPKSHNAILRDNVFYFKGRWTGAYRNEVASVLGQMCLGISGKALARFSTCFEAKPSIAGLKEDLDRYDIAENKLDECIELIQHYINDKAITLASEQKETNKNVITNNNSPDHLPKTEIIQNEPPPSPINSFKEGDTENDTEQENDTTPPVTPISKQFEMYKSNNKSRENTPPPSSESSEKKARKNVGNFMERLKNADIDEEELLIRGKLGEQDFYNHLLKMVTDEQKSGKFSRILETVEGFEAYDPQNTENCILKLNWPNKIREDYQSLDMELTYKGKVYIFEVKSTKYTNKKFVNISAKEWSMMMATKENHALVCIYNAGSKDPLHAPQVSILWNPSKHIFKNEMRPAGCILQWGYQTKKETAINTR